MKMIIVYAALFFSYSCSNKNIGIQGSWQEYYQKKYISGKDINLNGDKYVPNNKWTFTQKELIDSSVFPANVFAYKYKFDGTKITTNYKNYEVILLNKDTLILRDREYPNKDSYMDFVHYFVKTNRFNFTTEWIEVK